MAATVSRAANSDAFTDLGVNRRARAHSFRALTTLGALPTEMMDEVEVVMLGEEDDLPGMLGIGGRTRRLTRRFSVSLAEHVKQLMNSQVHSRQRTPSICELPPHTIAEEEPEMGESYLPWASTRRKRYDSTATGPVVTPHEIASPKGSGSKTLADEVWLQWSAPAPPPSTPAPSSPEYSGTERESSPLSFMDDYEEPEGKNMLVGSSPDAASALNELFPEGVLGSDAHSFRSRRHRLAGTQGEDIVVTQGDEEEIIDIVGDALSASIAASNRARAAQKNTRLPKKRTAQEAALDTVSGMGGKRAKTDLGGSSGPMSPGADIEMPEGGGNMTEAQQRRYQHNVMERQRRNGLNNAFDSLRNACCISDDENVAKVVILRNALDIISNLKQRIADLDRKKQELLRA